MSSSDLIIFLAVVGLRFGIPLLIPRFPLPAVIVCLVIDAADQTIFQRYTDINLDGYQGYDKALDVYYLAIAYLSTIRNWTDPFAQRVAQFLWYYRLVGVMLFELLQIRALLLVFPNTFEYFFIAYELVRCWWDPRRLSHRNIIIMAACIWIFIKLPQEWWIHVAQLDTTDVLKENILGVDVDTPWSTALSQNWWFVALLVVIGLLVAYGIMRLRRVLPPPEWTFTVDMQRHARRGVVVDLAAETGSGDLAAGSRHVSWERVIEKVVLTSLIAIIFSSVIPTIDASPLQITVAVALVVAASALVSQWLADRGRSWTSTAREFAAMAVVNAGLVAVYLVLLRRSDTPINEAATVFFVILLTLIITLFDRFQADQDRRSRAVTVDHGAIDEITSR